VNSTPGCKHEWALHLFSFKVKNLVKINLLKLHQLHVRCLPWTYAVITVFQSTKSEAETSLNMSGIRLTEVNLILCESHLMWSFLNQAFTVSLTMIVVLTNDFYLQNVPRIETKKTRLIFLSRFWPLLNQASFFKAAGAVVKIVSRLKPPITV